MLSEWVPLLLQPEKVVGHSQLTFLPKAALLLISDRHGHLSITYLDIFLVIVSESLFVTKSLIVKSGTIYHWSYHDHAYITESIYAIGSFLRIVISIGIG